MITQSDPGTENYGIANGHTYLRQWHDPNLTGTLQHRWMRQKKNVVPEIRWSQMRRRWSPGFENVLDLGLNEDWYNSEDPIQLLENQIFKETSAYNLFCLDCYFAGFLSPGFRRSWIVGECTTTMIKSELIKIKSYLMVLQTIFMIHLGSTGC